MSDVPQPSPPRPTFSGRWQIPLLAVGLALFGGGLIRIAAAYQPITFEEELQRVAVLRAEGALRRANAYLLNLLKNPDRPPEQRRELHRLLAATIHQAERPLVVHGARNVRSIIANFQAAMRYGGTPGAEDWVAVGDAYRWSQNDDESADAYRQALRLSPERPDNIRRKLVELRFVSGRSLSADTLADLDAILNGASSSPENYLWALEHKVTWLLERGDTPAALALVEEGKKRLSGTADRLVMDYLEALCLCDAGARYSDEAEALLRSLLDGWTVRDALWGKANWLLGRLQQVDGRPQAALLFYDEVIGGFQAGELHDACILGRAECLGALERYERSLETFAKLKDRLSGQGKHGRLDRAAVRATITAIGESLLQDGALDLGLAYMRLALALTDASDPVLQAHYVSRIAAGLSEMARIAVASAAPGSAELARGRELFGQAAEMYLALSKLQTLDERSAAASMESAADDFDAAGLTERVIDVLTRFAVEHPASARRAAALYRLGRAYQALQRYPEAVAAYEETIATYPRLLDAQRSMVPLAECLLAVGGEAAQRGADLLISIVDDRGPEPLFDPQAQEYRDALIRLAEYYSQAGEEAVPHHAEKAIARLEDAIAFYPDDPRVTRLRFLLADAYRQSSRALREERSAPADERSRVEAADEARRRSRRALATFERVISTLASHDTSELTELEQTYLRASYLYRGDCLFDLGRYEEAIGAYNEAVWRYENLPAAVSASMQIVHCHQRLGQLAEARAALERLSWLLAKIPTSAFESERGMSPKQYWQDMVGRLQRTGLY